MYKELIPENIIETMKKESRKFGELLNWQLDFN